MPESFNQKPEKIEPFGKEDFEVYENLSETSLNNKEAVKSVWSSFKSNIKYSVDNNLQKAKALGLGVLATLGTINSSAENIKTSADKEVSNNSKNKIEVNVNFENPSQVKADIEKYISSPETKKFILLSPDLKGFTSMMSYEDFLKRIQNEKDISLDRVIIVYQNDKKQKLSEAKQNILPKSQEEIVEQFKKKKLSPDLGRDIIEEGTGYRGIPINGIEYRILAPDLKGRVKFDNYDAFLKALKEREKLEGHINDNRIVILGRDGSIKNLYDIKNNLSGKVNRNIGNTIYYPGNIEQRQVLKAKRMSVGEVADKMPEGTEATVFESNGDGTDTEYLIKKNKKGEIKTKKIRIVYSTN